MRNLEMEAREEIARLKKEMVKSIENIKSIQHHSADKVLNDRLDKIMDIMYSEVVEDIREMNHELNKWVMKKAQ